MPAPVKISVLCAFRKSVIKVAKLSLISAHALLDICTGNMLTIN